MASIRDIMIIAVLLFAIGVAVILTETIGHTINSRMAGMSSINSSSDAVSVLNHADTALNSTDYLYLAMFIGLFFSIVITGWYVGGVPIFAPIYFFCVVIFTFISVILQLSWGDISAGPQIANTLSKLPITTFILSHLGYFMAIFGLVGILILFAKPRENAL